MSDVVAQELKTFVIEEMLDIAPRPGEEVVDAKDLLPPRKELLAQMRAQKSRTTGNQNAPLKMHVAYRSLFSSGSAGVSPCVAVGHQPQGPRASLAKDQLVITRRNEARPYTERGFSVIGSFCFFTLPGPQSVPTRRPRKC